MSIKLHLNFKKQDYRRRNHNKNEVEIAAFDNQLTNYSNPITDTFTEVQV